MTRAEHLEFRRKMDAEGLSCCYKCRQWLPKARFAVSNRMKNKCHGYCKECQKAAFRTWRTADPVKRLYHGTMRGRRLVRGERTISFEVTLEYLRDLWCEHGGRCAISGHPFDTSFTEEKNPFSPSLDRIDSSGGYVPGNVRFVCHAVNLALNEWGEETYFRLAAMSLGNSPGRPRYTHGRPDNP